MFQYLARLGYAGTWHAQHIYNMTRRPSERAEVAKTIRDTTRVRSSLFVCVKKTLAARCIHIWQVIKLPRQYYSFIHQLSIHAYKRQGILVLYISCCLHNTKSAFPLSALNIFYIRKSERALAPLAPSHGRGRYVAMHNYT